MTKCTSQQLLETGHKVTTMPSGYIKLTSPNRFYGYTESIGVRVAAVRCVSLYSLLLRIINYKLIMPSAGLTPPPPLTLNKYNTSQDGIDFRVVLSLSCLRALRLARSTSSRAFFVAQPFKIRVICVLRENPRFAAYSRAPLITADKGGCFLRPAFRKEKVPVFSEEVFICLNPSLTENWKLITDNWITDNCLKTDN